MSSLIHPSITAQNSFNYLKQKLYICNIYNFSIFNKPLNINLNSNISHNNINLDVKDNNDKNDNNNAEINNENVNIKEDEIEEIKDNKNFNLEKYTYVKQLKKKFNIGNARGDGNCLFYSLSSVIFGTDIYHAEIRKAICDSIDKNRNKDYGIDDINSYLINMRKEGSYGGYTEIEVLSLLIKVNISCLIRIIEKDKLTNKFSKTDKDKLSVISTKDEYNENIIIILDKYPGVNNACNHYSPIIPKEGYNFSQSRLEEIKNILNIKNDMEDSNSPKIVTRNLNNGKAYESRKEIKKFKLYIPDSLGKTDNQSSNDRKAYLISNTNSEINDISKETKINMIDCKDYNEVKDGFTLKNINDKGINWFLENFTNIQIKYKDNNIYDTNYFVKNLKFSEKILEQIPRCICYSCSGFSKKGNQIFRIYNSFLALKNHCRSKHNKNLNNCVINYELPNGWIEIIYKKDQIYYLIEIDSLSERDKNIILKQLSEENNKNKIIHDLSGGFGNFNNEEGYIKIIGNNIRTFNEGNRSLMSDFIENEIPDFILLNECNLKNAKFNMSGYNYIISDNQEVGIVYKNIYYLDSVFKDIEDNYNLIKIVNTKKGNLIIWVTYLPPKEDHSFRIAKFIERYEAIYKRYKNANIIVYGDLNIKRELIDTKLKYILSLFGTKIWYSKIKDEATRVEKVNNVIKSSYIDYFITCGIDDGKFYISNSPVITDHRMLSLMIKEDDKIKLDRIKEINEPFIRVMHNKDEISDRLVNIFKSDIPEIGILKLIHDNKFLYKPIKRKFKFRTNYIKNIASHVKELLKEGKKEEVIKLIHKHRTENWHNFLKELVNFKVNNQIKEYFLRLKFYTEINKNVDILKNLKINKNGVEKITLNKDEINVEVEKKYKDLLGDNGIKENYFDPLYDKVIKVSSEEVKNACKFAIKNKAVSWDLIPGICIKNAFKKLKEDPKNDMDKIYENFANIYNRYLIPNVMPEELSTSRLFCLNKKASEPGDVNNLRPIAINSTLIKILENIILHKLLKEINEKHILCNKQIGFMKGCGTEINLLRLRQRVYDLKNYNKLYTNKYLVFIDLKNAYDKVIHRRLFDKLLKQGISNDIVGSIKLLYSKAKLKISSYSNIINVNNGVLQGSLISPMLFNLYINDLIIEINNKAFEILAYADDLCILCRDKIELIEVFKIIDNWTEINGIKVNKKKSGIFVIKGIENSSEIEGYPIIKSYKYLGITINDKFNIKEHVHTIDKKLSEYFRKNFMLNKRYFSVKSIKLLFTYFHKSRLLYGLPAFIDQQSSLELISNIMISNIKKLLGLSIKTNNEKIKLALGLTNLKYFLLKRLLKLKEKYQEVYKESITFYDKSIMKILNINDNLNNIKIINEEEKIRNFKELGNKYGYNINRTFLERLNNRIYNWYVDNDHLLLKFMVDRGSFRNDIPGCEICILCKKENNSKEHVVNSCPILKDKRDETMKYLISLDKKTKDKTMLEMINYWYYSKQISTRKDLIKDDRKGINLIKEFIFNIYKKFGEKRKSNDND